MSHDLERLFEEASPPGLPPELRERVLAAVDEELNTTRSAVRSSTAARRRGRFRPGLAAAAALVCSLLLNYGVSTSVDRRLAAVLGPRPVPRQAAEIAAEIAAMTDSQTGKWAFDRLASRRGQEGDTELYPLRLKRLIDQLAAETQEISHEALQLDLEMDRDRRGNRDRQPPGAQRILRLEHRNTA
jgi:hypothetical protein